MEVIGLICCASIIIPIGSAILVWIGLLIEEVGDVVADGRQKRHKKRKAKKQQKKQQQVQYTWRHK